MSDLIIPSRRGFLRGLGATSLVAVAAPAVMRAASLMPIRAWPRVGRNMITFDDWLRLMEPVMKDLTEQMAASIIRGNSLTSGTVTHLLMFDEADDWVGKAVQS